MRWTSLPLDLRHQRFRPDPCAVLLASLKFIAHWDRLATQTCGKIGGQTGAFVRSHKLVYRLAYDPLWGRPPTHGGKRLIGKETAAPRSEDGNTLEGPFHQGPMLGL